MQCYFNYHPQFLGNQDLSHERFPAKCQLTATIMNRHHIP